MSRPSRTEFSSVSLMTLKEFSKSSSSKQSQASNFGSKLHHSFRKEVFRPVTGKAISRKSSSSELKSSFLHQVLVASSISSNASSVGKSSIKTLPSLLKSKELSLSQRPAIHKQTIKMDIFNLKTSEQQQELPATVVEEVKNETVRSELAEHAWSFEKERDGLDNLSFCSDDTVELVRDANEYFLEDDNRVANEKMFNTEMKFHRSFRVTSTAKLPSLKDIENKKNKVANAGSAHSLPGEKSKDFSCEAVYLESCRRQKVIPTSYFIRHMKDSEITLKHHGLGAPGIRPVSAALMNNADIIKLDLSDNWLGTLGAESISRMLRENCFISELNLSDNRLGTEGSERLQEVLKTNSSLTHLTFQGNDFDDSSAPIWADIIASTLRIEYLDLSHNNFGEDSGKTLGTAIAENTSIQEMNLSWNNIRRKGALGIAKGLSANSGIKKFNIGWNGLSQDGAKAFFKVLKDNECLEELDLSNNRIATEGAVYIAKGLISNLNLKVIKMGMNPMESAGCFAIIKQLQKNPETKLECIDFSEIVVDKYFLEEFKQFQQVLPNVKVRTGCDGIILKPKIKVHPIVKLRNFFEKKNMKLVDFFTKYDKDGSMTVPTAEFRSGIAEIQIKLTEEEIDQLFSELDPENEGEISYRRTIELLQAYTESKRQRKSTKSNADEATD